MIYKDISEKIKTLRDKLHKEINKTGIDSEETQKVSAELDAVINEFYNKKEYNKDSIIYKEYLVAYNKLVQLTKQFGEFPTTKAWNKYATDNIYLSNKSIEYISELDWNNLRKKVFTEINKKNF